MIRNPILPGFHPDPCICRKEGTYYLMVSSFEWLPGLPVFQSKDLKNWSLYTNVLDGDAAPDLRLIEPSKGVWAPCLTYCEQEDLFYVVYGVMRSMNARFFDVDNYLITARDLRGPWSKPVYLHSAGFDASLLHDDDGKKYLVSLEWETRVGYEQPGAICLAEYDPRTQQIVGYPRRIYGGGTDRGCIEGPHLYKRNGVYYLLCAEGGTGYNHCVTVARSRSPFGPYEPDPGGAILSSVPAPSCERENPDHLKPQYYNPAAPLQKAGHGSLVELPTGETYLVHHCARPIVTDDPDPRTRYRCTLGRETAIQKMRWSRDGWLRTDSGSILPQLEVEEPSLPSSPVPTFPETDDFDEPTLRLGYYAPRQLPGCFAETSSRPGWLRLRGGESQASLHCFSLLARKLSSLHVEITTRVDFHPEIYQHSAGLILYYDNMNNLFLRKYYSPRLGGEALGILSLENGERSVFAEGLPLSTDEPLYLQLAIDGRCGQFSWSTDGKGFTPIGACFDVSRLSDEYCRYGEFTGTMVGLACVDSMFHRKTADFDFFRYAETDRGGAPDGTHFYC